MELHSCRLCRVCIEWDHYPSSRRFRIGSSADHEVFPNDHAVFGTTRAGPEVAFVCCIDSGARSGYRSGSVWPPAPAAIEESHTRRAIDRTQPGAAFARAGEAASSQRLRLSQPLSQREEDSRGCEFRPTGSSAAAGHGSTGCTPDITAAETQEPSETPAGYSASDRRTLVARAITDKEHHSAPTGKANCRSGSCFTRTTQSRGEAG